MESKGKQQQFDSIPLKTRYSPFHLVVALLGRTYLTKIAYYVGRSRQASRCRKTLQTTNQNTKPDLYGNIAQNFQNSFSRVVVRGSPLFLGIRCIICGVHAYHGVFLRLVIVCGKSYCLQCRLKYTA